MFTNIKGQSSKAGDEEFDGTRTMKKKKKAANKVKEHPEGKKGKLNQCFTLSNHQQPHKAPWLSWRTFFDVFLSLKCYVRRIFFVSCTLSVLPQMLMGSSVCQELLHQLWKLHSQEPPHLLCLFCLMPGIPQSPHGLTSLQTEGT